MSDLDVYDDWVERLDAPTRQHVERMNGRISDLTTALAAERARAEAAEGREARLLTVIEDAVQVGEMTGADFRLMPWSTLCAVIDGCVALAGTETAQESLIRAGDELVREIDAALDGAPEAETTDPECRDGWHAIRPGDAACICGENRTERLL